MNNKSIWAALSAMFFMTGLQSPQLFPEEISTVASAALILLGGMSVYQMVSLNGKEKLEQEKKILSVVSEMKDDVLNLSDIMEESIEDLKKSAKKDRAEIAERLEILSEDAIKLNSSMVNDVREVSENELQNYRKIIEEMMKRYQESALDHNRITLASVMEILNVMDKKNDDFQEIIGGTLKNSEKMMSEGYQGTIKAIDNFSQKVSEFQKSSMNALIEQSDILSNNASEIEASFTDFIKKITRTNEYTIQDFSGKVKDMTEQMMKLADEYRHFEKASQTMLNQMTKISEEDYSLIKEIFTDEK